MTSPPPQSPRHDAAIPVSPQSSSFSLAQLLLLVVVCGTFLALARGVYQQGDVKHVPSLAILAGMLAGGVVGTVRALHFDLRKRSVALGGVVGTAAGGGAALLMETEIGVTTVLVGCTAMLLVAGGTRLLSHQRPTSDATESGSPSPTADCTDQHSH